MQAGSATSCTWGRSRVGYLSEPLALDGLEAALIADLLRKVRCARAPGMSAGRQWEPSWHDARFFSKALINAHSGLLGRDK